MSDPLSSWRDLFTIEEAAEFLGVPPHRLGYAVISGELRCGVMARDWHGVAIPDLNDIPRGRDGHIWKGETIETIDREQRDFVHRYRLSGTEVQYDIRTAFPGHFWYLHHSDAYRLFAVERDGIDVDFLQPVDGAFHHRAQQDRYPEPEFTVFIDSDSPNRRITLANVLFLSSDLSKLKPKKPLHESERQAVHYPDRLMFLQQAYNIFWANADPNDRGTHPANNDVANWLEGKEVFSSSLADAGATIIRPEWAKTGRLPEK